VVREACNVIGLVISFQRQQYKQKSAV